MAEVKLGAATVRRIEESYEPNFDAKAFFPDGKEPKFVNAVLDHMAREAKPEAF